MRSVASAKAPPHRLLFAEFGQLPMQHHWAGLVLRHWNSMVKMPGSLCHLAFRDDIRMAVLRRTGWTHKVLQFLDGLEFERPRDLSASEAVGFYSKLELPVNSFLESMARRLTAHWAEADLVLADPRSYAGPARTTVCRYACCMGVPECGDSGRVRPAPHAWSIMPAVAHAALMRFRLCVWKLEVNRPGGRPRNARVCGSCARKGYQFIEDEQHAALEW